MANGNAGSDATKAGIGLWAIIHGFLSWFHVIVETVD